MSSSLVSKNSCSIIIGRDESAEMPNPQDLQKKLETGNPDEKNEALKQLLICILNDESYPKMLMVVFNHILPVKFENHEIKKTLLLYWEVIEKLTPDGNLRDEIFLIINHYRNDLLHPNEYIRGRTLRLISRIMLKEIISPLIQAIIENLTHSNSYVKRNALMCIYQIFISFGSDFLPDVDEKVYNLLVNESDISTKRNAFLLLYNCNIEKALEYLQESTKDENEELGDLLQLIILELLRKTAKFDKSLRPRLNKFILYFSKSKSLAVNFECANTLIQISTAPTFLKTALDLFLNLLEVNQDNNIKLIILEKLNTIKSINSKMLEEKVEELIKAMNNEDFSIKLSALNLVKSLLSAKNIKSLLPIFESAMKSVYDEKTMPGVGNFQSSLLSAFAQILTHGGNFDLPVYECILSTLSSLSQIDGNGIMLLHVVIKKALLSKQITTSLINFLISHFTNFENIEIYKVTLHFFLLNIKDSQTSEEVLGMLKKMLGPLPLEVKKKVVDSSTDEQGADNKILPPAPKKTRVKTVVLPDGTYGTITIEEESEKLTNSTFATSSSSTDSQFRYFITTSPFLASVFVCLLAKLTLSLPVKNPSFKKNVADSLLILCSLGRLHQSDPLCDRDLLQKISLAIQTLTNSKCLNGDRTQLQNLFLTNEYELTSLSVDQTLDDANDLARNKNVVAKQVDDSILIRQLKGKDALNELDLANEEIADPDELMGQGIKEEVDFTKKLIKLVQLTGYNDPIYAEAFVIMNKYDIILEILLVNNTAKQIQDVTISYTTQSQNKLLENSSNVTFLQKITIPAGDSTRIQQTIRLNSNDFSVIYPAINYDNYAGVSQENLTTAEIILDIIEFVYPAVITPEQFRILWHKYDWENKVIVLTHLIDPLEYIKKIAEGINAHVLTNLEKYKNTHYISANLYAKTKTDEDFLINIALESRNEKVWGHMRIRSKVKSIIVNVGEKIKKIQAKKK